MEKFLIIWENNTEVMDEENSIEFRKKIKELIKNKHKPIVFHGDFEQLPLEFILNDNNWG